MPPALVPQVWIQVVIAVIRNFMYGIPGPGGGISAPQLGDQSAQFLQAFTRIRQLQE